MDWKNYYIKMALRLGPALLVLISFVAILVGLIMHSISINESQYSEPPAQNFNPDVIIGEEPTDLMWFLQVTDLHLSYKHHDRHRDFEEFVATYLRMINPDAVLVTGDITDGLRPNTTFNSGPQLKEWQTYADILSRNNVTSKTKWLDIRGNHDNFNVYRPEDPNNLYRQYSIQGKQHSRSYLYIVEKEEDNTQKKYSFIGVDEVQTPGLKLPFNFIGVVNDKDLVELKNFKEIAKKSESQYTIWFAHYPTSSIASPREGIRNIVDGPYLCGHFHTIGNWVNRMYSTQQPGFAELELGDWKHNRRLRLAAVDHQLFSFVDTSFRQLPIALMTNPKTAESGMPKYEPIGRIAKSTHIRVIAFSNATIIKVEISIDEGPKQEMKNSKGPLYTLKWDPSGYTKGLHRAHIYVLDSEGKSKTFIQNFSTDNSKDEFQLMARILLRAYFKSYVMSLFFFVLVVCTLPLLILRLIGSKHKGSPRTFNRHLEGTFLYNLYLLANIRELFWPLFIIPIWLACGPLFVGWLVDEAIGACFIWGALVDGTYVHTGITYNVGSIFLLIIHIPATILLARQVGCGSQKPSIMNLRFLIHLTLTALQLYCGTLLYSAFGVISVLTSFPFTWCIFIYAFCWLKCTTIMNEIY